MQRKILSADGMLSILRKSFGQIDDLRGPKANISTADALMTALSAFSFKFDSFRTFYNRLNDPEDSLNSTVGKLYRLKLAWKRVRANKGVGGVDGVTIEEFEGKLEENLTRLHQELKDKLYRPLGIPILYDRACQQAILNRMEPIFEPVFDDAAT